MSKDWSAESQQTKFLGGEWSPSAQGQIDDPNYRTALNLSNNGFPVEEGAWVRRSGRRRLGMTAYPDALGQLFVYKSTNNQPVVLELTFSQSQNSSYLRMWTQQCAGHESDDLTLLCDNYTPIVNLSADTPCVLTLASVPPASMNGVASWQSGDTIQIFIDPSVNLANGPAWVNRQFQIQQISPTQWQLYDSETLVPVDGNGVGMVVADYGNSFAGHVVRWSMPYTSLTEVRKVRMIQTGLSALLLSQLRQPLLIQQITPAPTNAPNSEAFWFLISNPAFIDGPYLDPLEGLSQTGNSLGLLSTLDINENATFYISDSSYVFQPGDVGRLIRLWCQPQPWQAGQTYNGLANNPYPRVTWQGLFYAIYATTNTTPGLADSLWYPESDFGRWGYGIITAVGVDGNPYACTVNMQNIQGPGGGIDNTCIQGNSVGPAGTVGTNAIIDTWQIGLYTENVWPTVGCYYQGRIWLGGALPNRLDACMSDGGSQSGFMTLPNTQNPSYFAVPANSLTGTISGSAVAIQTNNPTPGAPSWATSQTNAGPLGDQPLYGQTTPTNQFYFSPTNSGGQPLDDNGIAMVMNMPDNDSATFLHVHNDGIIVGSISGEYIIAASDGTGVLTPTSVSVRPVSEYGGAFIDALRVGNALIFVQAYGNRLMEYVTDFFSRTLVARHLNEKAKHLTTSGIAQITYGEELTPTIYGCTNNGDLITCIYRRFSSFATEPATFAGWSRHVFPDDYNVMSVAMAANQAGDLPQLVMLTTPEAIPVLSPIAPVPPIPLPPVPPPPVNPGPPKPPSCGGGCCGGHPGCNDDCGCGCCGCAGCGCCGCCCGGGGCCGGICGVGGLGGCCGGDSVGGLCDGGSGDCSAGGAG